LSMTPYTRSARLLLLSPEERASLIQQEMMQQINADQTRNPFRHQSDLLELGCGTRVGNAFVTHEVPAHIWHPCGRIILVPWHWTRTGAFFTSGRFPVSCL
jgi:hypothetical protein